MGNSTTKSNVLSLSPEVLREEFGPLFHPDQHATIKDVSRIDESKLSKDSICLMVNSVSFRSVKPPINPTMQFSGGRVFQSEPRDLKLWDVDLGEIHVGETKVVRVGETLLAVRRPAYKTLTIVAQDNLFISMITPYFSNVNVLSLHESPDIICVPSASKAGTDDIEQMARVKRTVLFLGPETRFELEAAKELVGFEKKKKERHQRESIKNDKHRYHHSKESSQRRQKKKSLTSKP